MYKHKHDRRTEETENLKALKKGFELINKSINELINLI